MCLSNGSSEFGNPTLLFFVIAVKCSLPACVPSSAPFKLKTALPLYAPRSTLTLLSAYCHFYYFSSLKFFNRTLGCAFHRCAQTRVLGESSKGERAHFFYWPDPLEDFALCSAVFYLWFHIWMLLWWDGRAILRRCVYLQPDFLNASRHVLDHFLKGDLTWSIYIYEWQLIIYMADY